MIGDISYWWKHISESWSESFGVSGIQAQNKTHLGNYWGSKLAGDLSGYRSWHANKVCWFSTPCCCYLSLFSCCFHVSIMRGQRAKGKIFCSHKNSRSCNKCFLRIYIFNYGSHHLLKICESFFDSEYWLQIGYSVGNLIRKQMLIVFLHKVLCKCQYV